MLAIAPLPFPCVAYIEIGFYKRNTYTRNTHNIPLLGIRVKKNIPIRPDAKAIGRRIRQLRGFDLTQSEFGAKLGIGQTQLSKYEQGQSLPTVEILLKLRAYSGVTIDWIITGEDSPKKA